MKARIIGAAIAAAVAMNRAATAADWITFIDVFSQSRNALHDARAANMTASCRQNNAGRFVSRARKRMGRVG